jgi:hypothetical protein
MVLEQSWLRVRVGARNTGTEFQLRGALDILSRCSERSKTSDETAGGGDAALVARAGG